jgi:hypothetical protein
VDLEFGKGHVQSRPGGSSEHVSAGPGRVFRAENSLSVSVPDSDPFGHGPGLLLPPLVLYGEGRPESMRAYCG